MQISMMTDFALRTLIFVAAHPERLVLTSEISDSFGISRSHLTKVVNRLGRLGYLHLKRGRYGGGMALAREAKLIRISDVVRDFEPSFTLVECMNASENTCKIAGNCGLQRIIGRALRTFIQHLELYTLADAMEGIDAATLAKPLLPIRREAKHSAAASRRGRPGKAPSPQDSRE
ncbi:MAG: hypothetical protein RL095_1479 [Verrucomicrobiota bacterium]|jgi:Rrf2 family nitric oxide-sensitive transcriptional repressor